jgi:hypothetical protein
VSLSELCRVLSGCLPVVLLVSDLLNAHLRRHEKRASISGTTKDTSVSPSSGSPVHAQGASRGNNSPGHGPELQAQRDQHVGQPLPVDCPPSRPALSVYDASSASIGQFESPATLPPLQAPPPPTAALLAPDHSAVSRPYPSGSPSDVLSPHSASSAASIPRTLGHQPFLPPVAAEPDYTWLFHGASLFDLPPEDDLDLHFGDKLGPSSPNVCLFLFIGSRT